MLMSGIMIVMVGDGAVKWRKRNITNNTNILAKQLEFHKTTHPQEVGHTPIR